MSTLAALIFPAILLFWAVGAYNRLVRLRNAIAQAFAQIHAPLQRRYELMADIVQACRQAQGFAPGVLEPVTAARDQALVAAGGLRSQPASADAAGVFSLAEQVLEARFAVLQDCGEPAIAQPLLELDSVGSQLQFARQRYNDAVLEYNHAAAQFPAVLLARLFGLHPAGTL